MSNKTIPFKTPVVASKAAESWVQRPQTAPVAKPGLSGPTKRLTVDITETLHRRLKLDSVQRGVMISDVIRQLLDEKYPPETSTNIDDDGSK